MSGAEPTCSSTGPMISLLTPNESRRIVRDEQRRRRIARLIQVRKQAKQESERIRQRVQERKKIELARARCQLAEKLREEKRKTLTSLRQQLDDSFPEREQEAAANERQRKQRASIEGRSMRQLHLEAVRRHEQALRAVRSAEQRRKEQLQEQLLQKRRAVAQANARSRHKLHSRPLASDPFETSVWTLPHHPHYSRLPSHTTLDRLERVI